MNILFLALLDAVSKLGEITETALYKGGEFSTITVKIGKNTFKFTISKEETEQDTNGNG